MASDALAAPSPFRASGSSRPRSAVLVRDRDRGRVSSWLFALCVMLLGMILLGGATRLTGSGLSIMEWQPLSGIVPPLTHRQWEHLFDLYKTIPQYRLQHEGFGLSGFQHIFWLEWIHRFWGRLMGVVLLVPLLWFAVSGAITPRLIVRLVAIFVFGGLQGAIGWVMVASGFDPNSTAVEPAKLVLHLVCAFALYAAVLWTAFTVRWPEPLRFRPPAPGAASRAPLTRGLAASALGVLSVTVVAGGFTAGTHAGFHFNTFPLIEGRWAPPDWAALHPLWRNAFSNLPAVQWDHRLVATLTVLTIGATLLVGLRAGLPRPAHDALMLLGWAVLIQYALGVTTLLLGVPVWAGTAHQFFAAILLGTLLLVLHRLRGAGGGARPA